MKLSILIPSYNEKNTILEVIKSIKSVLLPKVITSREIIIIDDSSNDGTSELLKEIDDSEVKVFYHDKNKGKGAALSTGIKHLTGDIVIIQDADLEYNPNDYLKILNPIIENRSDVVFGSRFLDQTYLEKKYFWHYVINKYLTILSNLFSGLKLTDMETCYKVFRRSVLDRVNIEENRFGFEPEITAKIGEMVRAKKTRICEVGITYFARSYEDGKKIGYLDGLSAFWCILKYNTSIFARFCKYVVSGVLIAMVQLGIIIFLMELVLPDTVLSRNTSNIVSIIISIFIAFFIHSKITWRHKFISKEIFLKKLKVFYFISTTSVILRIVVFYVLDRYGVTYIINTLIGIVLVITLNFYGYDKFVYNKEK